MSNPLFDSPLAIDRNNLTTVIVGALMTQDVNVVYADTNTGRIGLVYNNRRYFLQLRLRK